MPKNAHLYYNEPFGPVDSFIVVDTLDELINEMNISNGNLVSSIATDSHRRGGPGDAGTAVLQIWGE